jgi:hypothetical protein
MRNATRAAALVFVLGCAHAGGVDPGQVKQLTPGVSTRADAEKLFGPPEVVTVASDGNTYCTWRYSAYPNFTSRKKALVLSFRPDGAFERVVKKSATRTDGVAPQQGSHEGVFD